MGHRQSSRRCQQAQKSFELGIQLFGEPGVLVERLRQVAMVWDENGRLGTDAMQVQAIPVNVKQNGALMVPGRWHNFVVAWTATE